MLKEWQQRTHHLTFTLLRKEEQRLDSLNTTTTTWRNWTSLTSEDAHHSHKIALTAMKTKSCCTASQMIWIFYSTIATICVRKSLRVKTLRRYKLYELKLKNTRLPVYSIWKSMRKRSTFFSIISYYTNQGLPLILDKLKTIIQQDFFLRRKAWSAWGSV